MISLSLLRVHAQAATTERQQARGFTVSPNARDFLARDCSPAVVLALVEAVEAALAHEDALTAYSEADMNDFNACGLRAEEAHVRLRAALEPFTAEASE